LNGFFQGEGRVPAHASVHGVGSDAQKIADFVDHVQVRSNAHLDALKELALEVRLHDCKMRNLLKRRVAIFRKSSFSNRTAP
jgi:hypothetical protein